jgi:hypothetical protein
MRISRWQYLTLLAGWCILWEAMTFRPGEIIGDYEILGPLGKGGMGAVYRVRNVISDRVEAMKEVLPGREQTPDLAERFLREIRVHATLRHPNITQLFTAFRRDQHLLMIMELVEGVNLEEILQRGPMPSGEAAACMAQTLEALEYAHAHGVIHRDIKPANIVVLPDGMVKLLDFGIARGESDRRLTLSGMVIGSLSYMSPEQVGGQSVDGRSDVYSVGVTLYQAVTGGDGHVAILRRLAIRCHARTTLPYGGCAGHAKPGNSRGTFGSDHAVARERSRESLPNRGGLPCGARAVPRRRRPRAGGTKFGRWCAGAEPGPEDFPADFTDRRFRA